MMAAEIFSESATELTGALVPGTTSENMQGNVWGVHRCEPRSIGGSVQL